MIYPVVKSFISLILAIAASATLISATATLSKCSTARVYTTKKGIASKYTDRTGCRYTLDFVNVPEVSQSTICGHTGDNIQGNVSVAKVTCSTLPLPNEQSTMHFVAILQKLTPPEQLLALEIAVSIAFGDQGVNWNGSVCGDLENLQPWIYGQPPTHNHRRV